MSQVMSKLHSDHANVARLLGVLENQINLMTDGDPDWSLMTDIVDYMEQYPDSYHHPLEDQLFKLFLKVTESKDAKSSIGKLLAEHVSLREKTIELRQLLADLQANSMMLPRDILKFKLVDYLNLQKQHLINEERDIFPMITAELSEQDWQQLDSSSLNAADPMFDMPDKKHFQRLFDAIIHDSR